MNKKPTKSDLARLDRMRDADIDYSDIPEVDDNFFVRFSFPPKKQLTIRLDEDVLAWIKGHGRGYQTRINRILRKVMESQPRALPSKSRSASEPKRRSAPATKRRSVARSKPRSVLAKRVLIRKSRTSLRSRLD